MREKAVHAGLLDRWIKDKFSFPVFMRNRGVVLYGYAAKGLAVCGHAIAKDAIVCGICNHKESNSNEKRCQRDSLEGRVVASVAFGCGHGLDYTRQRIREEHNVDNSSQKNSARFGSAHVKMVAK